MPRPAYIERKIDFQLARQRAKRTHPQPCDCDYCISQDRVEAILRARIEAQRRQVGEPPF